MAYSETVLHRAQARLAQAKADHDSETNSRIEAIYTQIPRLREIDTAMRRCVSQAVSAAFRKGTDTVAAIEAIKEENLALQREREWLLEANELEESALEPTPICSDCGGSGYVGAVMCECLRELCRQEQKKELSSLLGGKENFDQFRLDYYPTEVDPAFGVSPRSLMQNTFQSCRDYAASFSRRSPSLLFTGAPGLGKTFLSACIARKVADSGFSVVYDTVTTLFGDFEATKFGGCQEDRTRKYLACDLLIIDDLGTEMTTQFTQSALYQVVNTRLMEGRPTIISTNLVSEDLKRRYPGPIASRLLGTYNICYFLGNDIRQLRR